MMTARLRITLLLALILMGGVLKSPALGGDIVIEPWDNDLSRDPDIKCNYKTYVGYTVDVAAWTTPFHGPDCWYNGPIKIKATMTRYEDSIYRHDQPRTVTSTLECSALAPCDSRIEMPHPSLEQATYEIEWQFEGYWPEQHIGKSGKKWVWTSCESKLVLAECPERLAIRVPDP